MKDRSHLEWKAIGIQEFIEFISDAQSSEIICKNSVKFDELSRWADMYLSALRKLESKESRS